MGLPDPSPCSRRWRASSPRPRSLRDVVPRLAAIAARRDPVRSAARAAARPGASRSCCTSRAIDRRARGHGTASAIARRRSARPSRGRRARANRLHGPAGHAACTAPSGSPRARSDAFAAAHQDADGRVADLLGLAFQSARHPRTRDAAARAHRQPARSAAHDGRVARHPAGVRRDLRGRPRRAAARRAGDHLVGRGRRARSGSMRWPGRRWTIPSSGRRWR